MNESSRDNNIDNVQSARYAFPYHYLPSVKKFPNFSKTWGFAASYIAAINLFSDWFRSAGTKEHHKHMDYGCGDGGFVNAITSSGEFPTVIFHGIDYDDNAVRWATLFSNDEASFSVGDVANLPSSEYDSGSLIEVYEHIPPNECDNFLRSIAGSLKTGAPIFVTVPSTEKPVSSKHYRHFDFDVLSAEFSKYFDIEEVFGFERTTFTTKLIGKLLVTRRWYVESVFTNNILLKTYGSKNSTLKNCGRIGMIARRR